MQQLDIPIITKTYELYRALHDLQKEVDYPKVPVAAYRVESAAIHETSAALGPSALPDHGFAQREGAYRLLMCLPCWMAS